MSDAQPWNGNDRRRDNPMGKMEALTASVERLTAAVDKNNEKLEKIIVLENNDKNHTDSIERAFESIKELKDGLNKHSEKVAVSHQGYDKWIWTMTGVVIAVSVGWTVFGTFISNTVSSTSTAVEAMKIHIATDKIMSMDDVKAVVK